LLRRRVRMKAHWRELKVGDRIRIVRLPTDWTRPGYYVHRDTRSAYKKLIARRRPVRVCEIDAWGLPFVRFRFRRKDSTWEHHWLAVNDDSWVRVKHRPPHGQA
jgi:hypothetical protein